MQNLLPYAKPLIAATIAVVLAYMWLWPIAQKLIPTLKLSTAGKPSRKQALDAVLVLSDYLADPAERAALSVITDGVIKRGA